jgi:hypothetical protein
LFAVSRQNSTGSRKKIASRFFVAGKHYLAPLFRARRATYRTGTQKSKKEEWTATEVAMVRSG